MRKCNAFIFLPTISFSKVTINVIKVNIDLMSQPSTYTTTCYTVSPILIFSFLIGIGKLFAGVLGFFFFF